MLNVFSFKLSYPKGVHKSFFSRKEAWKLKDTRNRDRNLQANLKLRRINGNKFRSLGAINTMPRTPKLPQRLQI